MNTPLAAPEVTVTIAQLVHQYRRLRDKKKEIEARHKSELGPFNEAMGKIEMVVLDHLNRTGVESARTDDGTAYKVTRRSYAIDDPGALRDYVEAHGLTDLYENRLSSTAIEDMLARGLPLPPGIRVSSSVYVNIKK